MFLVGFIKSLLFFTGSYSNQIFPEPLSLEEEEKAIDLMLNGDEMARNRLIEHNLRLVAHIVKKFESKDTDTDDLITKKKLHVLLHMLLGVLKMKYLCIFEVIKKMEEMLV